VRLTIRSPKVCLGPYMAIGYCTNFGSNLHQEERFVTPQNRYYLVALHKCCPLVGSVRGWLGVRLTIRSPKLGLGPYMGYRLLYQLWVHFTPRRKTCDAPKPGLDCSPTQGPSTGRDRYGLFRGEVDHPEPQTRPGALYGL